MPIIFIIEIDASSLLSIKIYNPPFDDIFIIHDLYYFVKFFVFVFPISVRLGKSWTLIYYMQLVQKKFLKNFFDSKLL